MRSLALLLVLAFPAMADTVDPGDDLEAAVQSFRAHDLERAERLLLAARQERPEDARVAFHLGRVWLAQGRAKDTVDELERAIRLDPASSAHYFWLAEALVERIDEVPFFFKLGVAKRMRAAYEKAVELDPEYLEARVAVARYHAEAPVIAGGDAAVAEAQLEEIARRDPALARVTRALIHERLGRPGPAEDELRAAREADPKSVIAWRETGFFYQRRERWEEAKRAFEEALACDAEDRVALYEAARSAVALSEQLLRRAERALGDVLRLEPGPEPMLLSDVEPPRRGLAHRELGRVYERLGRPELAAREYESAARLEPGDEEARTSLTRTRGQTGCSEPAGSRAD